MIEEFRLVGGWLYVAQMLAAWQAGFVRYPVLQELWIAAVLACLLCLNAAAGQDWTTAAGWFACAVFNAVTLRRSYDPQATGAVAR